VETPALLPLGAPTEWNRPFFNLVASLESDLNARDLLRAVLEIENTMGRVRTGKWSPRKIDIDLLCEVKDGQSVPIHEPELILPHPGILSREFVLDPLAEIAPRLSVSGKNSMEAARALPAHQSKLMGILNLTPDSFSDGGRLSGVSAIETTLDAWDAIGISAIDIGGESTRPGAKLIDEELEWTRLLPVFSLIKKRYGNKRIKPKISVDTRHALTAQRALDLGADIINDVSGLNDPNLLDVLKGSSCDIVLMHSLSVPPIKTEVLPEESDPVLAIKRIWEMKLRSLEENGINRDRILLDPGIGFGKTSLQSLVLLRRIKEFESLGSRILSGHSRKSFIQDFTAVPAKDRDAETLGISFELARRGVDYLRVHDPVLHHRAFLAGRQIT
jgi:2-amino-4-hydroxy-6-hydroxymethyldihydropteridine diphosphokinase/dihydropteroate synthase